MVKRGMDVAKSNLFQRVMVKVDAMVCAEENLLALKHWFELH